MDMPGWMRKVQQQLAELDRRLRSVGADLSLTSGPGMPFVRAVAGATQSVGFGAWVTLNQWSQNYSHPDIVLSGPTTTFTFQRAGVYDVRFVAMFRNDVSSAGVRGTTIWLNGATVLAGYYAPPLVAQADYASSACDTLWRFNVGDSIQFRVLQNTAGNVTMQGDPYTQCSIRRVGD